MLSYKFLKKKTIWHIFAYNRPITKINSIFVRLQELQDALSNPNVVRMWVCVYVCTLEFLVNLFEIAITRKVFGGL